MSSKPKRRQPALPQATGKEDPPEDEGTKLESKDDSTLVDPTYSPSRSRPPSHMTPPEATPTQCSDVMAQFLQIMTLERQDRKEREAEERKERRMAEEQRRREEADREERRLDEQRKREDEAMIREQQHQLQMKQLELKMAQLIQTTEQTRIAELQTAREEANAAQKRREEQDKLREAARAAPPTPAMTPTCDLQDYLEVFEGNQIRKRVEKSDWASHLIPLLNDTCRNTALSLPSETRESYEALKEALLVAHECSPAEAAQHFWELKKTQEYNYRTFASKIERAYARMAPDRDFNTAKKRITMEKFLQSIPREIAAYVRNKDPDTLVAAAEAATRYTPSSGSAESYYSKRSREESGQEGGGGYHRWKGQPTYGRRPREGGLNSPRSQESQLKETPSAEHKPKYENYSNKEMEDSKKKYDKQGKDIKDVICFVCGGRGHFAKQCPSAVSGVNFISAANLIEQLKTPPMVMAGELNGQEVQDLVIDPGSSASIIAEDMLPEGFKEDATFWLEGFDREAKRYPFTTVRLGLEGRQYPVLMAVVSRDTLKGKSALLGRNH